MNMSIHVEYLSELSEILPHKISRGQEAADMTVRGVNKNEKEFKGGIIACTQRVGILVILGPEIKLVFGLLTTGQKS